MRCSCGVPSSDDCTPAGHIYRLAKRGENAGIGDRVLLEALVASGAATMTAAIKGLRAAELRGMGPDGDDTAAETDEYARTVCRLILRDSQVYDAHGCPWCLG